MAERDPIEVIREQMNGAEEVAGLHAEHGSFISWHAETRTILEKVFSPKSIHCQNFLALRFREEAEPAPGCRPHNRDLRMGFASPHEL